MSKKATDKNKKLLAEEFKEFLNKHNVQPDVQMNFPEYRVLPADLQLALQVLSKHASQFILNFKEKDGVQQK